MKYLHNLILFLPLFYKCQLNPIPLFPSSYPGRLASRNLTRPESTTPSHCDWRSVSQFLWGAFSDDRVGLTFVYSAGPCQRSLSRVRVPWYSRPYFTVSVLRLPFSSPPTIRRFTVEAFEPASTLVKFQSPRIWPGYIWCSLSEVSSLRPE
jgi:hypothetical protein